MFQFIKKNFWQIVKFGVVGCINTCTSLVIYYILLFLHFQYLWANVVAYFASTMIGYLLNKFWVFQEKEQNATFKYYLVYISSFFLNMACMYLWVDILNISKYIAPLLTLLITVPYNYLFSKFWVFRPKKNYHYTHSFALVAYQESPYIEECIQSLLAQTVPTTVFISTSTPNDFLLKIAKKYHLELITTNQKSDIQADWNYAYNHATTDLVTLAHQDDIYEKNYVEEVLKVANQYRDFKMIHTDYWAYKNGQDTEDKNSKIKRLLKIPLRCRFLARWRLFKVGSLAFGNSVNCPSVTYHKKLIGENVFTSDLKFGLDWDTFLKLANQKGIYLYLPKKLIHYRIHDKATTKEFIQDKRRLQEDRIVFGKIWPPFIVNFIMKFYVKSYETYDTDKIDKPYDAKEKKKGKKKYEKK